MKVESVTQEELFIEPGRVFETHQKWIHWLNESLPKPKPMHGAPVALDLFAGCGGLGLGFEVMGFHTLGYEMKPEAVKSYNDNLSGTCKQVILDIGEPDVSADIIVGGPPCQPFSQIGYQQGKHDPRDGFPVFLDCVNRIRPRIAIIENVRGLLYRNKEYLRQVVTELERFGYTVQVSLLNTALFGVPQKRERVVIVASMVGWEWPEPVVTKPVSAGIALGPSAQIHLAGTRILSEKVDKYIATYEAQSKCVTPRDLHLDRPSRTVTCRNLHAMTADMLRIKLPDGRRRMLHVSEAARLQSFPDWFKFAGSTVEQFEQIGNAVAPLMGLALARQAIKYLEGGEVTKNRNISASTRSAVDLTPKTPKQQKLDEAISILQGAGVRMNDLTPRRKERLAMALLSAARLKINDPWKNAKSYICDSTECLPLRTKDFYSYWNEHFEESYALGGYDDVKRLDIDVLLPAGLIEMAVVPTSKPSKKGGGKDGVTYNAGSRGYTLTEDARTLLRGFGTDSWPALLADYRSKYKNSEDRLSKHPELTNAPVKLPDGTLLVLSSTNHNEIQRALITHFLPRYAPSAEVLYVANTGMKKARGVATRNIEPTQSVLNKERLSELGINLNEKKKLPDVILFDPTKKWIFLIEAVHSKNPISEGRHIALAEATSGAKFGRVYVTAFLDRAGFAKFSRVIDWKTEAWIASEPEHLIHFDGERFLGPYEENK